MADLPQLFAAARFKLEVRIKTAAGQDLAPITDVVAVSATFALNTIPTASIIFATGKNTFTNKNASIHDVQYKIGARDKITVYLEVVGSYDDNSVLQAGRYKIFDGFIAGTGYQRAHNHANFVINAVHWLDDLNNATAINGDWFAGAPANFARAALLKQADANGDNNTLYSAVPGITLDSASFSNITTDMWNDSLKNIFTKLAEARPATEKVANNQAALDALARMPNAAGKQYYKPLALDLGAAAAIRDQAINSVGKYYKRALTDVTAQNSFWAKLVADFAADFMFAVSPAVDWAFPIPFCGGLNWDESAPTIKAKDYNYASLTTNMSQIIEAVHIIQPTGLNTDAAAEKTGETFEDATYPYFDTFASYPPSRPGAVGSQLRGLKLFKRPPIWLDGVSPGMLSGLTAAQNAMVPGAAPPPGAGKKAPGVESVYTAYKAAASIAENLATHWYCTEVLQQRAGELSGPLRFDIAPGSIVKIETPPRDTINSFTADQYMVVSIAAVSYVINAERATAGTSFVVAHTRTPVEEANEFYTVPRPPLYSSDPFYGGPLTVPEP